MGSYPADNVDLSEANFPITLIYGSLDPAANDSGVLARQHLLPQHTTYVRIEGCDHHQFGSYVIKPEDRHAIISGKTPKRQILAATP